MQTTGPGERMDVEGMRGTDAKASTQRRFRAAGGSLIPTADGRTNDTYTVELVAGQRLTLTLSCDSPAAGPVAPCQPTPEQPLQLRLAWTPELGAQRVAEAEQPAADAEVAVVFGYTRAPRARPARPWRCPVSRTS
jgi:beta-glucosidase